MKIVCLLWDPILATSQKTRKTRKHRKCAEIRKNEKKKILKNSEKKVECDLYQKSAKSMHIGNERAAEQTKDRTFRK